MRPARAHGSWGPIPLGVASLQLLALLCSCAGVPVAAQVFPDLGGETLVNLTGLGMVQGRLAGGKYMYRAFRGLPFAEPPVGELRFQPPVPKQPWAPQVFQAAGYGDMCTQRWPRDRGLKHGTSSARPDSEDCLVLDVYTPRRNASRPPPKGGFPVWFF